jgi:hypothetical protein
MKRINFSVVLYGCRALIFRDEHRLRVFDNRVLRTFGPKRAEVIGGLRKVHNEELRIFYSSRNIIRFVKQR